MQKITPFLWFNDQAEEAAKYYVSIFKNSKIGGVSRYGDAGAKASGRPKGSVMTVAFQLAGQEFVALNGGPHFKFTEAVSLVVNCESQAELDELWDQLSVGGEAGRCGWLKDRYGLSWQIVPSAIGTLMQGSSGNSDKVMQAILQMNKLDIEALKRAAASVVE